MRPRRWLLVLSALLSLAMLSGCVNGAATAPSDPRSGGGLRYGLAPSPNQGTTFQKDVVLVDGGASSIRSVTADGLTWTLSPDAGGVADLRPGRVMFVTDRGVGRVMAVHNSSAGVEVTIGPVTITDVIRDGKFASTKPIPLSNPIAISAAGAFWADPELQQQAGVPPGSGGDVPTAPAADIQRALPTLDRPPSPQAIVDEAIKATTGGFKLTGTCCTNGPGAAFNYNKNGLSVDGSIAIGMDKPDGVFDLRIVGGSVTDASLSVTGAAGLTASLHATADPNKAANGFSPPLGTDFAFSVPVGNFFGVPLTMVVTQHFTVSVNIPGQAHLDAVGKVSLSPTLGFSYHNGRYQNTTGAKLDSAASLSQTNSIAVGISFAEFNYNVRFTVGLGYLGFVAGVFLTLAVHVLASVGAPIGINPIPGAQDPIEHCKAVQSDVWIDYGVGYEIPSSVVTLVNYFLEAFKAEPISNHGGFSRGFRTILVDGVVFPDSGFCVKK